MLPVLHLRGLRSVTVWEVFHLSSRKSHPNTVAILGTMHLMNALLSDWVAKTWPNLFDRNRTGSLQVSKPRYWKGASTNLNESGKRTHNMTTSLKNSGDDSN